MAVFPGAMYLVCGDLPLYSITCPVSYYVMVWVVSDLLCYGLESKRAIKAHYRSKQTMVRGMDMVFTVILLVQTTSSTYTVPHVR